MSQMNKAAADLEAALSRLESAMDSFFDDRLPLKKIEAEAEALRRDRAQLAQDLDASKAREIELEALADEASRALGMAISEVRAALSDTKQ